jgi:hypothetical protein
MALWSEVNADPKGQRGSDPIESESIMPVVARFCGIVIRLLCLRSLGARLHAFYRGSELVIELPSLTVLEGEVPLVVRAMVIEWARQHYQELLRHADSLQHPRRSAGWAAAG